MWIAGYNNPGYLPDGEPEHFETFDEARDYITWTLDQFVDDLDVGVNDGDEYNRAIHFFNAIKEAPVTMTAGRYAFWIERDQP